MRTRRPTPTNHPLRPSTRYVEQPPEWTALAELLPCVPEGGAAPAALLPAGGAETVTLAALSERLAAAAGLGRKAGPPGMVTTRRWLPQEAEGSTMYLMAGTVRPPF